MSFAIQQEDDPKGYVLETRTQEGLPEHRHFLQLWQVTGFLEQLGAGETAIAKIKSYFKVVDAGQ